MRSNNYRGCDLKYRPMVFRSERNARNCTKRDGLWLVMGAPGEWLAVCPADARRLERAGFEIA